MPGACGRDLFAVEMCSAASAARMQDLGNEVIDRRLFGLALSDAVLLELQDSADRMGNGV